VYGAEVVWQEAGKLAFDKKVFNDATPKKQLRPLQVMSTSHILATSYHRGRKTLFNHFSLFLNSAFSGLSARL
jgi:hypothetical protein